MSLIFVSYRRQDTQSATGRLCDKLQAHFGADQVFHDIGSIDAGSSFPKIIASKIAESSVVLVMIGRHWLDAAGGDSRSRLFDPVDYVRLEVEAALQRDVPVIPVLVEGAAMPAASALPESIAALATRQAHEITEQRWQYDTDLLVKQIERSVAPESDSTDDGSTLLQTLMGAVAGWPFEFAQLLLRPRRQPLVLVNRPNAVPRSAVFFTVSHLVAAWLFVLPDFVASVPMFVLEGVPQGVFLLLLIAIPVHLAARLVHAPSHPPTTTMMLAYIQSVAMVLAAAGSALLWTGLTLSNPQFGSSLRSVVYATAPLEARVARVEDLLQTSMGGPFFAAFVVANAIWLYTACGLVASSLAFRDLWRLSWLRAAGFFLLVTLTFTIAGAIIAFAATL